MKKCTHLGDIEKDANGDTKPDPDKKKKGDQPGDFYSFSKNLREHIKLIKNLKYAANSLQNAFDSLQKQEGLHG